MKRMILIILLLIVLPAVSFAADYVLVVNKNNPVSSLSREEAKQIYLGKKTTWDNGQKVLLYSQSNSNLTEALAQDVMKKTAQQLQIFWKKALFTGTGYPPIELSSDSEVKKFVAADPKGIGYISAAALDDTVRQVKLR